MFDTFHVRYHALVGVRLALLVPLCICGIRWSRARHRWKSIAASPHVPRAAGGDVKFNDSAKYDMVDEFEGEVLPPPPPRDQVPAL